MIGYVSIFIVVVLMLVTLSIYTGSLVYTNYNAAKIDMEKALTSAVTEYLISTELKDTHGLVVAQTIEPMARISLLSAGWSQPQGNVYEVKTDTGDSIYYVDKVTLTGDSTSVTMHGRFRYNMPFRMLASHEFTKELSVSTSLTYIEMD